MTWTQISFYHDISKEELYKKTQNLIGLGAVDISYDQILDNKLATKEKSGSFFSAIFDNYNVALDCVSYLQRFFKASVDITKPIDDATKKQAIANYQLINIANKLIICPLWKEPSDDALVSLKLNNHLAWGSGRHPSTILCLEWIVKSPKITNSEIIDYGCGSGILGLTAVLFGAKKVFATDVETKALEATKENAKLNDMHEQQISTYQTEKVLDKKADIIFANLFHAYKTLLFLNPILRSITKIGGIVLLCGFTAEESEEIAEHYKSHFDIEDRFTKDGWELIVARRIK